MTKTSAKTIAMGGMLCALAMVIMCLVGLIPVATYICPMLCCILGQAVLLLCGKRIAWAWYAAVSIMSLLFAPDKEGAMMFVVLGYYPIVKPRLDAMRLGLLIKLLLFNLSVGLAYVVLIFVMGMQDLGFGDAGWAIFLATAVLGNITFFLLDRVLMIFSRKWNRKK